MTKEEQEQLTLEIDHIFESGANGMRVYEMVKNFIDSRNVVNKNFDLPLVSEPKELLFAFIAEVKKEFADTNLDYLDFIAYRVLKTNKLN
jgi:hypothetical protein